MVIAKGKWCLDGGLVEGVVVKGGVGWACLLGRLGEWMEGLRED